MKRFGTVSVFGNSMAPTYNHGDWLVLRRLDSQVDSLPLGSVLVIEREDRPGIFLIKRLQKSHGGRFWVEGDSQESTDSRQWGWICENEIRGKVLFRYKRGK